MVSAADYRINELGRFRILVGGICASACMSTFYGFNLLSNYMQTKYKFGANDLTTITTTGIVVGFVTFPGGMLLDYAGPMYVCLIATVLNSLGTLLFGLAYHGLISASVVKFAVFCAIMNLGCASFDTGSLMAVMGSFPRTKGLVVAIMKTFAGLGASVFAVINYSFFRTNYPGYMYFMTIVVVCAGTLATILIRFPPYHIVDYEGRHVSVEKLLRRRLTERAYFVQNPPLRRFYLGLGIVTALVIYLTTQSLCVAYVPGITDTSRLGITIGVIILVFCLFLIAAPLPFLGGMRLKPSEELPEAPAAMERQSSSSNPRDINLYLTEEERRVLRPTEAEVERDRAALDELRLNDGAIHDEEGRRSAAAARDEEDVKGFDPVMKPTDEGAVAEARAEPEVAIEDDRALLTQMDMDPQYQGTFWQNLRTVDLWLCWWNTLATWGCGVVISFNSAQIYRALNDGVYEGKTNTLYSAIIGVGSALGRMSMGIIETVLVSMPSSRRPVITTVYPVASCSTVLGLIFLLALPLKSKAILIGFFFDAFGNGFSWACTALTIRSLYAKDIGKHYNFMFVGAFIAVIALNRFAFGELFSREARRQGTYPICGGKLCVQYTLIILVAVNSTAILGSLICHYRYRRYVMRVRKAVAAEHAAIATQPFVTEELPEAAP